MNEFSVGTLFVIELIAVFLYKTFVQGKRGVDQIPHFNFCMNVLNALKVCFSLNYEFNTIQKKKKM